MADYLTVREVAAIYNVHEMTVRRHIAAGRLRAVRVGRSIRVRRQDLEAYSSEASALPGATEPERNPAESLLRLIGIVSDPTAADLSENKYAYLAEAYAPKP